MAIDPVLFDLIIRQGADYSDLFRLEEDAAPAPPFVASTYYRSGTYLTPIVADGSVFRVMTSGTAAGTEPTWPTVMGGRVTSGGATFMKVGPYRLRDTSSDGFLLIIEDDDGATAVTCTLGNGRLERGYNPPSRENSTAYVAGQTVIPVTPNGWIYRCEVAGTSDSSAPTWPTALGQVVTDGTVTWRCVDDDDDVSNFRISLTDAVTGAFTNWGYGRWYLEWTHGTITDRLMAGNAVLDQD